MSTLLLLSLLTQVQAGGGPVGPVVTPVQHSFSDGTRSYKLYESATLVAESKPTDAQRDAVLAADASAMVVLVKPTMRIWKVQHAARVREAVASLRPVFHDISSGGGRMRVPLGLVCGSEYVSAPWQDVLSKSGASCLPDFWYAPVLR